MFSDDVILFGQETIKEAQAFMAFLQKYCSWSGQAINLQKLTVYFSKGVPRNQGNEITSLLGMSKMKNDATYLGIPLFRSKNRSKDMQYLVRKVLARIDGWKSRLLSKVGRACLIQSVGTSIPIYIAASEVIPSRIANKMEQCLRNFWWGDNEKKKSFHTISWSSICKSKFKGGLGFRKIKNINSALLLKWGWKLITDPHNLWSSIMNEKYLKGRDLFDAELKGTESMLWKAILRTRSLLKEGLCRKIRDGRSTSIWFDAWVPNGEHMPQPLLDATQRANLDQSNWDWKILWNSPTHGMLKMLWWQLMRDALPTREKIGMAISLQTRGCPICEEGEETTLHLFWECYFAKEIWFGSLWGMRADHLHYLNWTDWMSWFHDQMHRQQNLSFDEFMLGALCIFQVIWEARNEVVHGTRLRPIMEVINSVNRLYKDHLSRWKPNAKERVNKRTTKLGWWNCCTNVSIQTNQSFEAAVFRVYMDRIVAIYSERFSATDPTLVEATILASATEFARANFKGKVAFYCDNEVVVSNCSNTCNTNRNIDIMGVADRFKSAVRSLDEFKLKKIDRNCNYMAHM
uniref:Reverse transcriptase domain-containing protein n=1 Tax=Cannabis sativa TaxID=3483 RepID=A0A803QHL3_CANSA